MIAGSSWTTNTGRHHSLFDEQCPSSRGGEIEFARSDPFGLLTQPRWVEDTPLGAADHTAWVVCFSSISEDFGETTDQWG
jgi:hypothetical protein